jgi:hypothetical protein
MPLANPSRARAASAGLSGAETATAGPELDARPAERQRSRVP